MMGGETKKKASSLTSSYPKLATHPVGKKIRAIYYERLRQFDTGGQYEGQSLRSKIKEASSSGPESVKLEVYSPPALSRPSFKEATRNEFNSTAVGQAFGPSWSTHWFRITLTVPRHLQSSNHLEFHWDANNEGLIWTAEGEIVHGLTGGGERVEWILPKSWYDGTPHVFYVEMACNGMFGNAIGDSIQPPPPDRYYTLHQADIVAINLDARALQVDFWIIGDAAREFPEDSWESHKAFGLCNKIMGHFIAGDYSKSSIKQCRQIAQEYLGTLVDSPKVYQGDKDVLVTAIGHCHIDTCWLWPWAETKRKVARSWSNQCDLIDRYDEYNFCASQAQQYQWLKQYYPALFDRVKEKVKKSRFHPIGGSWVEHDTNMPSGESLIRQFLYGQRFFQSNFGQRCQTFWLPDTFGYSAQLPQICRLVGLTRFFTQKLSWNNINNFPHTTFNWVALDGSQVLCHMTPAETYNADAHFGDLKRSVTQHKSLDQDATSLLVFGKGDGGGGPTWEHIEKLRRNRAVSDTVGILPRVALGDTVDDFFAQLEEKVRSGTRFVTWYGELYFELHRGTYTTQANNKRNNRKSEFMLRDLEYLCTLASVRGTLESTNRSPPTVSSYKYPKEKIDFMWEGVLLCQFHDCLPGSSIEMCYDDSEELYKKIFETGERVISDAMNHLGFRSMDDLQYDLVAINTLPWYRSELVRMPIKAGKPKYSLATGSNVCMTLSELTAATDAPVSIKEVHKGTFRLSNPKYNVTVKNGVISSLFDKETKREVLAKGQKANQFVLFDDKPLYWQAWDVEVYHLESRKELPPGKSYAVETGPHRVSVATVVQISKDSWLRSTISLDAAVDSEYSPVTIETEVEWHETMKFLKVEFPVDVVNTEASYECQFGIVRRPTHYNTTWDMAKFEVCCHKWADLSEAEYGVSVLNDSKYGFATCGNLMRLSLLRSPKAPDAHADMGRHHIRYAILPHKGSLGYTTVRAGYNFNNPIKLYRHENMASLSSLLPGISVQGSNSIIVDTIKRAEDDEDVAVGLFPPKKGRSIIVRVFDALGGRCRGKLVWGHLPVKMVTITNALEDELETLDVRDGGVEIELRAFEVLTLKLCL